MTIENDLEMLIKELDAKSEEEKSWVTFDVLGRFDQAIGYLKQDKDVSMFAQHDFVPPSLRGILTDYISHAKGKSKTIATIRKTKRQAESYLRKQGYNPDIAEEEVRKEDKASEKMFYENFCNIYIEAYNLRPEAKDEFLKLPNKKKTYLLINYKELEKFFSKFKEIKSK